MNGGAEQAMKPTMKILSATVPLGRRFRVAVGEDIVTHVLIVVSWLTTANGA